MGMTRDQIIEQEDYWNSQMSEEELEKKAAFFEQEFLQNEVAEFLSFQRIMNSFRKRNEAHV